jgi:hypothetical protein
MGIPVKLMLPSATRVDFLIDALFVRSFWVGAAGGIFSVERCIKMVSSPQTTKNLLNPR